MSQSRSLATALLTTLAAGTLLAGCGGGDDEGGSDAGKRPENAYVRLADGTGAEQDGKVWIAGKAPVTVKYTAHGGAVDGTPTTLKVIQLTGDCEAARSEPCPDADDAGFDVGDRERIELPSDGSEKAGEIELGSIKRGTRVRVSVELCRGADCWGTNLRTYRRPTKG